jgi:putative phage-type endonuclease
MSVAASKVTAGGNMISINRFIAPSSDRENWLKARRNGVTATMVSKAATPSGFETVVKELAGGDTVEDNAFMKFGRDSEQWIALSLRETHGIMPNEWLIAAEVEPWMMATPDGLSLDHSLIAEIKTTGTDWGDWSKVPIHYRRQVQWQLFVTGAEASVFAWVLRRENKLGEFVPAWFEPKTVIVERDPKMIDQLVSTARKIRQHQLNQITPSL